MMRWFMLVMIRLYQRYISPYKGFGCAYRIHTGHQSCSALGYRAIRRYGVWRGWAILRRRTYLCGVAHRRYSPLPAPHSHGGLPYQRGFCDVGCDLPDCSVGADCDYFDHSVSICDCADACDWRRSKDDKQKDDEKYVYIPPNTKFK